METARVALPDLNTLDTEALKALILVQHAQLRAHETEIEHLKLLIAKLRRRQFGRKSERLQQQIEKLDLRLEDLEPSRAEDLVPVPDPVAPEAAASLTPPRRPARKPLPEHLRRQTKPMRRSRPVVRPAAEACVRSAKMFPRCWSTCRPTSKSSASCVPS